MGIAMNTIDLRSDTVTKPTPEMREAMASAEVGDDVFGDDPTVNRLEEMAAALMGKEKSLFVPSGTMGNLAAMLTHCGRGDEVILGNRAHTFLYEAGGMAAVGGIHPATLPNQPDGTLHLDDIRSAIRDGSDVHQPETRLICIENTHNATGGVPLTADYTRKVGELARAHGLRLHIDGARIFNAAAALDVAPADLADPADSVTFCLSKALCAPVGALLCGEATFIEKARRVRKQLGGGMRQAGVLAAPGIVSLETTRLRLGEDHRRAKALAKGLASFPGIDVDPSDPPSNMVYFRLTEAAGIEVNGLAEGLAGMGVRVYPIKNERIRLVTHYWIGDDDVARTIEAFEQILSKSAR